jgi:GLPGLI family protein
MTHFIFLLACLLSFHAFSQLFRVHPEKKIEPVELAVTYRKVMQMDSLDPQDLRNEKMLLWIGRNTSVFFSYYRHIAEEKNKQLSKAEIIAWMNSHPKPQIGLTYRIHKNYPEGKITNIDAVLTDLFLYHEKMPLFTWEIQAATGTILGYPVQKATTRFRGRSWVAWFAPGVPISDGPYKFHGLPGLILKMYDTRNHFLFEALSIESPSEPQMIVFIMRDYFRTTVENFFRTRHASRIDASASISHMVPDGHARSIMAENIRRRFNPIELRLE